MQAFPFLRGSWLLVGAAFLLLTPALGRTQGQLASKDDLDKAFRASDNTDGLRGLLSGDRQATKADEKHAVAAAQYYLYRVTIKSYLTPATPTGLAGIDKLHREFNDKIVDFMDKRSYTSKRDAFRKMFGIALVNAMKDVLARDVKADPTTVIQAAEMLPTMAKLKQADVSNYLCELAKDSKNPVVQLHALKALREVLPVPTQPDFNDARTDAEAFAKNKGRDAKNVDTLREFIEKPRDLSGMTLEEARAVIYIRREAIVALANAGAPAVYAVPNKKVALPPEGPAAHTLLKVLSGDLQPPPTLQEKVEAALGLCSMKYPFMPEYEPQLAIYLIGRTLEEFTQDYAKDWGNFAAVGVGANKKLPQVPYIVDARLWKAGLKELVANTPSGTPAAKSARDLEGAATPIFNAIIGNPTKYGPVGPGLMNDLSDKVKQARPKTDTGYPFKTLKMPAIKLGK